MKDLIILGNGMAGMTAALYAKRANLDFKIVGRDEYDFGQIGNAIFVENYPCAAGQSGFELADSLHDQLIKEQIQVEEKEVSHVNLLLNYNDEPINKFLIEYADGSVEECKSVIYALGARHRELNCEIDKSVPIHYCVLCDGALYKDKDVAIIGGGDSALTQAEYLSKICSNVFIITCDKQITAAPAIWQRVLEIPNVSIDANCFIEKIYKTENNETCIHAKQVEPMLFGENIVRGRNWHFKDMGIFVAIGMIPNTSPLPPLVLDEKGYVKTLNENLQTPYPGLFAAGDVRQKDVRQALTAAADGAIAVNSVINYLKEVNVNV